MRADMAKVIVERPRKKGRSFRKPKGERRRIQDHGEDGPPSREGIRTCWGHRTKYLNEHLGPLRRYLDAQVGRPWDKVFSEICRHIDRSSAVQDHVRDHVERYVVRNVLLVDGVPCSGEGDWNHGRPLSEMWHRFWYVCPRTGLLRRNEVSPRPRYRERPKPAPPVHVRVSELLQCRFHHGVWHLVTLAPLPPSGERGRSRQLDVLLGRRVASITPQEAREVYGAEVRAVASRPLARRELRNYPIPMAWWEGR